MSGKAYSLVCLHSICSFSTGGEDGFVRIHHLDPDYFDFKYDEEDTELPR
jgi:hypothetical protein